jgi:hypothetical protein
MKEFVCMVETPQETQKKIRTWVASGYKIEIVAQSPVYQGEGLHILTSMWRKKCTDNMPVSKYNSAKTNDYPPF